MKTAATSNITRLLVAWGQGDQGALDALAPLEAYVRLMAALTAFKIVRAARPAAAP